MLNYYHKEISKVIYDHAMENRGYVTSEDKGKIFTESQLCGYGIYSCTVYEMDGKYMCRYYAGSSCD